MTGPQRGVIDTSSLDQATAEHLCATINQLRGRVTILFITHALPKTLKVDEIVHIGAASVQAPAPAATDIHLAAGQ